MMHREQEKNRRENRRQRGFTLVEIMIVLVLIALLGGLVAPKLLGKLKSGQAKAAKAQIDRLGMAVETYYLDTGRMPSSLQDLVNGSGVSNWNGPYVKESSLKDPWGNPYHYQQPGQHGDYDIISYGSDGAPGGEGSARDITSWE